MDSNSRKMIFLLAVVAVMLLPDRAKADITIGDRLSWYLNDDDTLKSDKELALEAQYLADQWWKLKLLEQNAGDKIGKLIKKDEHLRGAAMALEGAKVGKVGGENVYGVMWSPDGRGYKTGREFKDAMLKLWKEPENFVSKEGKEFQKLDRARKLTKAKEYISSTRAVQHFVASICNSDPEFEIQWEDRIILECEMQLRARNAWKELLLLSGRLSGGAKNCLDALILSPDGALPERWMRDYNLFRLEDQGMIRWARFLLRPRRFEDDFVSDLFVEIFTSVHSLMDVFSEHLDAWAGLVKQAFGLGENGADDVHCVMKCPWMKDRVSAYDGAGGMTLERECEDYGLVGEAVILAVKVLVFVCPIVLIGFCKGAGEKKNTSTDGEVKVASEREVLDAH